MKTDALRLARAGTVTAALLLIPSVGRAADTAASGPAAAVRTIFHRDYAARLVPLLLEVVRFPTVAGNAEAFAAQRAWLAGVGGELGLVVRDAGPITEVELPGPPGAPVLGLLVHGDVQPVAEKEWSVPPFAGVERDGFVWGRGAADDKGPLVQALLAMRALAASGVARTHTVRLLVGSDEESTSQDLKTYLVDNRPPDLSLVIDSSFPVVVGEKAWNALTVTVQSPYAVRASSVPGAAGAPWELVGLEAGISASIVPSRATATLRWRPASLDGMEQALAALAARRADGLALEVVRPSAGADPAFGGLAASAPSAARDGVAEPAPGGGEASVSAESARTVTVVAHGRAAHSGLNLEGGRNALVFLARALDGTVAASGAADLLAFAVTAGADLYGTGLGLTASDPLWGRYAVNVATVAAADGGGLALTVNLRRTPPLTGPELRTRLETVVAEFNARRGARLVPTGFYDDEPLVLDPDSAIVRRLLAAYARATGRAAKPAISGGSTYAKRLPHAIAFGMWFPDRPYPGHDVDERIPVADLLRGADVLIEALADLATTAPVAPPERVVSRRMSTRAFAEIDTPPAIVSRSRSAEASPECLTCVPPVDEAAFLRADAHSFVFTRGSSGHASALYGGIAFDRRGGAFGALVKNPKSGYRETVAGLFTGLAVGRIDLSLALAYADASDGRYLQLYVSPSLSAGAWSLSATVEAYQPIRGAGLRQLYVDPLSFLRHVGAGWDVGASYVLGISEGDAPRHRAGPAAQLALPLGAVRAEALHDFHDGSNDVRVIFQAGF